MGLVKTDRDEELWSKAKAAAKKQGHTEDWAYINGIYQRMKGHNKAASFLSPLLRRASGAKSNLPSYLLENPEVAKALEGAGIPDNAWGNIEDALTEEEIIAGKKWKWMPKEEGLGSIGLNKKGNDMSKRGSLLDSLFKTAGKVPGVPDATGPYGRGEGPGKGTKSGLGLVMAKMERGEELTEEEKAILETARGKIKK